MTSNYTDYPCPAGHVCPVGTRFWNEFPCPVGTYNGLAMRTNYTHCLACPGKLALQIILLLRITLEFEFRYLSGLSCKLSAF